MSSFYSHLKCALSTIRKLIFIRTIFRKKIFKLRFYIFVRNNFYEEIYFTYIARIKFRELQKKDILPVAVTFCLRLKMHLLD